MRKTIALTVFLLLLAPLFASSADADQKYIRRASVTARSGPASYFDAAFVLKKGAAVSIAEAKGKWMKVSVEGKDGWIPATALTGTKPKGYSAMGAMDAGDIASSPAGLAAAAKGFASSFAKKAKAQQIERLMSPVMKAKDFIAFLEKFRSNRPERFLPYEKEYVDPPFMEGWESKLGLAIAAKLAGQFGIVQDVDKTVYLTLMANIIGLRTIRFEIPWKVFILNSDDLNAFGLTDGYILITQGLINKCGSEEEVAAILAHEIAHVVRYHNLQEIAKRKVNLKAGSAMAELDDDEELEGEEDFEDLEEFALQAYNHIYKDRLENYEYEADQLAAVYLYRNGYSPQALISLLQKVKQAKGDYKAYSGHPPISKRIAALNAFIQKTKAF
jgi:beta-barrel assembly-enhancing protease